MHRRKFDVMHEVMHTASGRVVFITGKPSSQAHLSLSVSVISIDWWLCHCIGAEADCAPMLLLLIISAINLVLPSTVSTGGHPI
jgi:hypothetical protein